MSPFAPERAPLAWRTAALALLILDCEAPVTELLRAGPTGALSQALAVSSEIDVDPTPVIGATSCRPEQR